jgi:integrase
VTSPPKVQNYANIYNRVFKPMLVENGIVDAHGNAKFGIHSLRHAATSLFIEQGWNPKKIQTLLGHASITMTMDVYGHLFDSAEGDVAMFEKLERIYWQRELAPNQRTTFPRNPSLCSSR